MSLTFECFARAPRVAVALVALALAAAQARSQEQSSLPVPGPGVSTGDVAAAAVSPPVAGGRAESRDPHPRIGLVLSGGGARGMAHIGVLKVLDEMRVPVHAIAGTSMGAVVGGLYASGMPAEEIERVVSSIDWQDAFRDRISRDKLAFRRKQDDQAFLVRFPLGLKDGDFVLPRGLITGQKLNQMLRRFTIPVSAVEDFDHLPIPYRAVATNLETGDAEIMKSGDLAEAMRASMSAPGVFAPVEIDGKLLIDGGIAENLPIAVARQMDVDVLIVVDVSFPLLKREQLNSALEVSNQMLAILTRRDAQRQRKTLSRHDVLIEPPLGDASSGNFGIVARAITAGEAAARQREEQLSQLALSPEDYARHVGQRTVRAVEDVRIDFVRTDEASRRYGKIIDTALQDFIGKPLDVEAVGERIERLYGLETFESVDYHLVEEGGRHGIEVMAARKSWGPNYIRFGLRLQDDFEGNNSFNAGARVIVTEINDLGAEWLTDLQVGENPRVLTEFYQPLTYGSRYFIAPQAELQIRNLQILDEEERIAEFRLRQGVGGLDFGRELGTWGEIRTGLRRGYGTTRLRIGDPSLPEDDFNLGAYFVRFSYDKLDSVNFPRDGELFSLQWTAGRTDLGDDNNSEQVTMDWLVARTFGRHTFIGWTTAGSTIDADDADVQDLFPLGGLFQLSGRRPESVSGPHFGIARALYYRQIGRPGPGFLNVPVYAGMSFEVGNAWENRGDASWGTAFKDVSVFMGLDTFVGPLYLATGYDDEGETAFYLFLGRPF